MNDASLRDQSGNLDIRDCVRCALRPVIHTKPHRLLRAMMFCVDCECQLLRLVGVAWSISLTGAVDKWNKEQEAQSDKIPNVD